MTDDELRVPSLPDDEPDFDRPRVVIAYLMAGLLGVHVVGNMLMRMDVNLPLCIVLVTGFCTLLAVPFAFRGHD